MNPRPPDPQSGALPLSYIHHINTRLAGVEPATYGLEVRCSIQLSYRRMWKSGREDSNLRPSAPKADALAGLRYAPIIKDLYQNMSLYYNTKPCLLQIY